VTQGAFLEIAADIVFSSDDDDATCLLEPHKPAMPKGSIDNDVGVVGTASAEALIPGLIGAGVPNLPRPSITVRVPIVPPARARGRKCPPIAAKRPKPVPHADQVTT
jgi:hypothetical protein